MPDVEDGSEAVAILKGQIRKDRPTLVRMHRADPVQDVLLADGPGGGPIGRALRAMDATEAGVVVILPGRSWSASLGAVEKADGNVGALRDYGIGAQILAELEVRDVVLLTNTRQTPVAIEGFGVSIVGYQPL